MGRMRPLAQSIIAVLDSYVDTAPGDDQRVELVENLLVGDALAMGRRRVGVISEVQPFYKKDERPASEVSALERLGELFPQGITTEQEEKIIEVLKLPPWSTARRKTIPEEDERQMGLAPMIQTGNDDNFYELVIRKSTYGPVLAFFYSSSCSRCTRAREHLAKIVKERGGPPVVSVNVLADDAKATVEKLTPMIIPELPTIRVYRDGKYQADLSNVDEEELIGNFISNEASS